MSNIMDKLPVNPVFSQNYEDFQQFVTAVNGLDDDTVVNPAELKVLFEKMVESIKKKEEETGGLKVVFADGFMIQGKDVGGYAVTDVFENMIESLKDYEPPILQQLLQQEEEKAQSEPVSEYPNWLKGREYLVWKGKKENPLWLVHPTTYDNQIKVSFMRRNVELKPGKSKHYQAYELPDMDNIFSREDWQIIYPVIREFEALGLASQEAPEEIQANARAQIKEVLNEERAWRNEKSDQPPVILKKKIEETINKIARLEEWDEEQVTNVKKRITRLSVSAKKILEQLLNLNKNCRQDGSERMVKLDQSIVETPTFVQGLNDLLKCFDYQQKGNSADAPKGLVVMLGEPGVGKNEVVKYLAGKLNRPFFWYPCGRGMEAQDLVHHYEFDTKEGTKRYFTDLAAGLQTPGAVVMIDEANALKPEVQALLHGLGDSNRAIKFDGIEIKAAEGVLIVLAGNPATQGSAGNLSEAILSRSRGQAMTMNYPALTKGELIKRENLWSDQKLVDEETKDNSLREYACDEVLVLYKKIDKLAEFSQLEFEYLWERVLNEKALLSEKKFKSLDLIKLETAVSADALNGQLRKLMIDLRDIMRVADLWRKKFEKKTTISLVGVSLRDTLAVVDAYKKFNDVRKAYLFTFNDYRKNPIDGLDEVYINLEEMLDQVLGPEVN